MSITWLSSTNSKTSSVSEETYRITFITKPKGLRANATLTRAFRKIGKRFFRFGYDEEKKIIYLQLTDTAEGAFKLSFTSTSNSQVNSAFLCQWAVEHDLEKARLTGAWDEEHKSFAFPVEVSGVAWIKPKG